MVATDEFNVQVDDDWINHLFKMSISFVSCRMNWICLKQKGIFRQSSANDQSRGNMHILSSLSRNCKKKVCLVPLNFQF